ncbi:hypothetical protein [Methylobacterium oxalidis]|uniref:General secretion pathway protein L n=1 Tax=Methylobacterium oxalidis TaxID=944322 RepID=A0A512IZG1_9HYPH|nr:hypothetical protein [Methylobacterium oxalidis]GEP03104.1 hypothetical protein MOX02_11420 [Methylobacterium oxalidis]GJE31735.1 hypothetical protein LDDCCGHA_1915 [Methylobacterium oxalidis]GLS67363.1 hypothetical protein GCM10007888_57470 [Methylobacterium oxalidis]
MSEQTSLLQSQTGRIGAAAGRWLADLAGLFGEADARPDRARSDLTVRPGTAASTHLGVIDRREASPRSYRLDRDAEDLAERLRAIRGGGRGAVTAKVLIEPEICFVRALTLPVAALPRMREVLEQELAAATPFRAEAVYSDWYVEGEDAAARTLRVRHVVLKRARLDPVLDTLRRAGLEPGPVTVGRAEDQAMPVDLLSGGRRPVPRALRGLRRADLGLLALALVLAGTALALLRAHQEATLASLDAAILSARRAATPDLPPPLLAASRRLAAARAGRPGLDRTWETVAAALPDTASAERLRLEPAGLSLTLLTREPEAARRALATIPGFGPPGPPAEADQAGGRIVLTLPATAGAAP